MQLTWIGRDWKQVTYLSLNRTVVSTLTTCLHECLGSITISVHLGFCGKYLADQLRLSYGGNSSGTWELNVTTWEEIVRDHGPATYRTAWRILGHAQDCEDVVQEVFLAAHKHFARNDITHWRTFLNRLVTFRSLDALRRRKQTVPLESATVQDSSQMPEEHLMKLEETSYVRSMIGRLPDRQAVVFCLAHLEGHSIQEIASILQISPNAVSMALHKGRANLRKQVAMQQNEQD